MNERLKAWIARIDAARGEMNALAMQLEQYGATVEIVKTNIVGEIPYRATFVSSKHGAVTTVKILLMDHQTDSEVVITHLTTLPADKCGQGFGSKAIQSIVRWATDNKLNEIRATQVSGTVGIFWGKNGFVKCPHPNPCGDYLYSITTQKPPT